jgi:AcrR family transcriptional regulator
MHLTPAIEQRGGPIVNGDPRHRRTQAERSATTRAALVAAARDVFGAQGFSGASREQIAERAGVTRGALYHHFGSKEGLFVAVCEEAEQQLVDRVATAAMTASDPLAALRRGSEEFLDAVTDPAVQRILLVDAPAVMGWERWREMEARYGLGLVTEALRSVMDAGLMAPAPVEPLGHMLLAALNEAALVVAGAADKVQARAEVGQVVDHLIERLAIPAPPSPSPSPPARGGAPAAGAGGTTTPPRKRRRPQA